MSAIKKLIQFFTPHDNAPSRAIYVAVVGQMRQPVFFADMNVPDTLDGRFDLLLLHTYLVMRRLRNHPALRQELFDMMFRDMDRNLREMGVGDMSISKKMKPMIAGFYGRAQAYDDAIAKDDATLMDVVRRNVYGKQPVRAEDLSRIAHYIRKTILDLDNQKDADIISGKITFIAP